MSDPSKEWLTEFLREHLAAVDGLCLDTEEERAKVAEHLAANLLQGAAVMRKHWV